MAKGKTSDGPGDAQDNLFIEGFVPNSALLSVPKGEPVGRAIVVSSAAFSSFQSTTNGSANYQTTWYRWVILSLYTGCSLNNAIIILTFSPIATYVAKVYDVRVLWANMCAICFSLTFIPMNFVAIKMYKVWPVHYVLRVGVVIQLLGAWLRYGTLLYDSFWFLLGGQMLASLAAPLILNATSCIASDWFSDKQRNLATSVAGLSAPLGNVISLTMVGIIFAGYDRSALVIDLTKDGVDLKARLQLLLLIQNGIVSFFNIGLFIFVKEKPDNAPSRSATEKVSDKDLMNEMKDLMSQKDYVLILTIFTFCFGIYVSIGALLGPIFAPFGYGASAISLFGSVNIFSGVIGCVVTGILLDKTQRYLLITRLICFGTMITYAWGMYAVPSRIDLLVIGSQVVSGLVTVPIIPAGFSFSVELTHPSPAPLVNGFMLMFANLFSLIMSFTGSLLCEIDPIYALGFFSACAIVPVVCSLFLTETLKKSRPTKRKRISQESQESITSLQASSPVNDLATK